jgi:hypothetical protein
MWSDRSWDAFCSLLEHGWPGEFSPEAGDAYRALLDPFEPSQAIAALRALLAQGARFRPSAAEIVGAVTTDPGRPTWDEAYRDLRRALSVRQAYHASIAGKQAVCLNWLNEHSHPLVAAFFEAKTYARLSQLPVDDPDYGQLEIKRLREDWEAFTERAEERQAHGLPIGTGARKQLGPHKPDFAAALPPGRDG